MGTFAKIFIVVNLVLAVVVLGAGAALLGTAESWKERYTKDDVSTITADAENRDWTPDATRPFNQSVIDELKKGAGQVDKLKAEIDKLKSSLLAKTSEVDGYKVQVSKAETEWLLISTKYNELKEDFGAHTKAFAALEKQLKDERDHAKQLQGRIDQANADSLAAKKAQEEVESNLVLEEAKTKQLEDDLAGAEKNLTALAATADSVANELALYKETFGSIPNAIVMKPVQGVVTGIDEDLNIVLISVGTDDDVAVGYTFKVFRGGEFVGMLVVDRVGPDWAAGHMDKDESKSFPQRGDDVATKL
jgi:hypothetical protein